MGFVPPPPPPLWLLKGQSQAGKPAPPKDEEQEILAAWERRIERTRQAMFVMWLIGTPVLLGMLVLLIYLRMKG